VRRTIVDGGTRVNVGDELSASSRTVSRDDIRAYAEASGDRNPLHLDDDVARAAGFDEVIAHGMLTMGHMASCVVAWAGPDAFVERISAQFRATVSPGDTIVAGARVKAIDGDRVTLDAWVRVSGGGSGQPIRRGEVLVRLAHPVDTLTEGHR
jgi:acyl dehydratase